MNKDFFEKDYLLTRVDFDRNQKLRWRLADLDSGEILSFSPEFEEPISIEINLSKRFCIGWHSLETGKDFVCPENHELDKKYEQCQNCQKRTGFNPAFYNVKDREISKQQRRKTVAT